MTGPGRRWLSVGGVFAVLLLATAVLALARIVDWLAPLALAPFEPAVRGAGLPLALSFILLAGSTAAVAAHSALRPWRPRPAIAALVLTVLAAGAFLAYQAAVSPRTAFVPVERLEVVALWFAVGDHGAWLAGGLLALVLSGLFVAIRPGKPSSALAAEAALWHWHLLDSVWLALVWLAWRHGMIEYL